MEKNKQAMFTPLGGMNQDDSIITPALGAGGASLFANGDYRYARNLRIGSSRSNNFGDGENIKSTVESTSYRVRGETFTNPSFQGSMTGWSNIIVGVGQWVYINNSVFISPTAQSILYQTLPGLSEGDVLRISYNYTVAVAMEFKVVFLNNTTILSTQVLNTLTGTVSGSSNVTIPSNCNGIGFQVVGLIGGLNFFTLFDVSLTGWTSGSRPSGRSKTIGKYEDTEFLKIYQCNWNENGNHTIVQYDFVEDVSYELLRWSGLNWSENYFVKLAKLDNWIAFTDRNNSPRLIDVDLISDLFLKLGSSQFREFHISFHKWAPVMPPITKGYWDGSTDNWEKFKNKVIQFRYRYVYDGNLRSCWSPASTAAEGFQGTSTDHTGITAIELFMPGFILDNPGANVQYNYFGHDDIKFTACVKNIEIAFKEGSNELWRMWKSYGVKTSGNKIFRFDGIADNTPIDTNDISQPFDVVPFKAGTVEAIDNRFVFGDCLDELDAAQEPVVSNTGIVKWSSTQQVDTWWNYGAYTDLEDVFPGLTVANATELGQRNVISDFTHKVRGLYKLGIIFMHHTGWVSGVYTTQAWLYDIPAETASVRGEEVALTFKLDASFRPPSWAVAYQIVRCNCLNIDEFIFGIPNKFDPIIDNPSQINDLEEVPDLVKNNIRQHFENAHLVTGTDFDEYLTTLKNKPFWNSTKMFLRKTQISNLIDDASRIYININNWYNSSKKDANGSKNNLLNKIFYNYREGDRIRFTGSTETSPTQSQKIRYDVPIIEFTGRGIIIEKPKNVKWLPGRADSAGGAGTFIDPIIEVYTPKTPQLNDFNYYEVGEWYPILYPGTENRDFAKRDWTYTNNAAITSSQYGDILVFNKFPFARGDCHFFQRRFYRDFVSGQQTDWDIGVASMNQALDETYGLWDRGNGRPNFAYTIYPTSKFKPTQARFGGKIIEESFVNSLNRFLGLNQFIYPSEYGRIRDLVNTSNAQVESVGAILLAIGERESWSIYVNRTTIEDLSGRTQVGLSDKILGSYNTLLGGHGTLNPESISKERGNVYFWDSLKGSWIRYGRDGLTEISSYKMRSWFRELGALLIGQYQSSTPPRVISDYDVYNEELVTRIDHSSLPETFRGYSSYKGAFFSEMDTRWKSVHDYSPELFAKIGSLLVSFKDSRIYKHEQGSDYGSFYGTKYDSMIEPVFNENPKDVKHWQTITNVATDKWSVDRIISEYRGLKSLIQSSITIEQFEELEDAFWAAVKNDVNTPNVTNPIVNGRPVKSKAIQVLMRLNPSVTHLSLLHYVLAGYTDSPKNA